MSDLYQKTAAFSAGQQLLNSFYENVKNPCLFTNNVLFDTSKNLPQINKYEVNNISEVRDVIENNLNMKIYGLLIVKNSFGSCRNYGFLYSVVDSITGITYGYLSESLMGEDLIRP